MEWIAHVMSAIPWNEHYTQDHWMDEYAASLLLIENLKMLQALFATCSCFCNFPPFQKQGGDMSKLQSEVRS